jgi:BirA family transcriptional regulator, biotin operon repressor / biotin---[acetyl-CoA-carboxylase] ligase
MTAPLTGAAIAALCPPGIAIEVVAETGSTNADLLARLPSLSAPALLLAECQTAGRGRAGRSWLSAPGATLTFSLAWKLKGPLHQLAGLPLAVGVALAEALAQLDVKVQLKWPNDVLKDGAKLAGILIETRTCTDGAIWAVIGIGLNLRMPDQLEAAIGRSVAAAPWLAQMDRNRLMAALLDALAAALRQFDDAGFGVFCARWNRLHAHQGQAVVILDGSRVLHQGRAAGVDQLGRLLLDTSGGRLEVLSGDVSLQPDGGEPCCY